MIKLVNEEIFIRRTYEYPREEREVFHNGLTTYSTIVYSGPKPLDWPKVDKDMNRFIGDFEVQDTVELIKKLMMQLTNEQRIDAMSGPWCKHCGTLDLPCHCWNDE